MNYRKIENIQAAEQEQKERETIEDIIDGIRAGDDDE